MLLILEVSGTVSWVGGAVCELLLEVHTRFTWALGAHLVPSDYSCKISFSGSTGPPDLSRLLFYFVSGLKVLHLLGIN